MPQPGTRDTWTVAFNHDCTGLLLEVANAGMTEEAVEQVFIDPLVGGVQVVDLCVGSAAVCKFRTRHGRSFTRDLMNRSIATWPQIIDPGMDAGRLPICGDVVEHFLARSNDLIDVLLQAARRRGLRAFGGVRLNHSCAPVWMEGVPGRAIAQGMRRDFRDEAYQRFVLELIEDVLERDVAGLSLDFERKAPFFADDAPQAERFEACHRFLARVRALTDKPLLVRVAHDPTHGEPQGQQPERWMVDGLVDIVVPATHNHLPDTLDWRFDRFLEARSRSPRPVQVWPQIWPTDAPWIRRHDRRHPPERVCQRVEQIRGMGADGVYFFNFHGDGSAGVRTLNHALIDVDLRNTARRTDAYCGATVAPVRENMLQEPS